MAHPTTEDTTLAVGINDEITKDETLFKIYPNPTNEFLRIKNDKVNSNLIVQVYDLTGKLIYNESFENKKKITTSDWVSGNYILTIFDNNKLIFKDKIIVQ